MEINQEHIEEITGQQLRSLPTNQETEEGIYATEGILELEDNDEISAAEGGFMLGYLNAY